MPQIVYEDRIDDVIDLAAFTRIYERTIWEALKERYYPQQLGGCQSICRWSSPGEVIPTAAAGCTQEVMEDRIHQVLCTINEDYADLTQ